MTKLFDVIKTCRFCESSSLIDLWSFGKTPLANAYVAKEDLEKLEFFVPLDVCRCSECNLVQLRHTVSPEILFRNYLYVSSTSPTFVSHFQNYAAQIVERFRLPANSLVVEIGSNDGILLKPFKIHGMKVLGVEPAGQIAHQANQEGIETINDFFDADVAADILKTHGAARVITANNVFAHMPDVRGIVAGIKRILVPDGIFVFEVQYLKDLIEKNLFDMVYHEHLFYYHLAPLVKFFKSQCMRLFDAEHVPVHGGSIRVFVGLADGPYQPTARLRDMIKSEVDAGLNSNKPYLACWDRIQSNKEETKKILKDLKAQGKRVVGYGAPAKATTLMYALGIGPETLDYIVDDDKKFKQGRCMPGSHIPIVPPERLYENRPDYCLILAWNFADQIIKKHALFTKQRGKFIIPIPNLKIICHDKL